MKRALFLSVLCLGSAGPAFAAVGAELPGYQVVIDLNNRASLQRGAKYFVNYCMGCHSLQYSRYSRVGEDLGLDMQMVADNLIFNGRRVSERMEISMSQDDAERWFGAKPPDLSMLARRKGATYIYQYLMTFYVDENRPWGVNNWRFPVHDHAARAVAGTGPAARGMEGSRQWKREQTGHHGIDAGDPGAEDPRRI